jgi:cytoskeletal protein CcmA (bactofilin family)
MIENDFKKLNFSVLGKNSSLEGDFNFHGDTLLGCKIKGTISMLDKSKITLERGSEVEGSIYCHDIEVFGSFSGSINALALISSVFSLELKSILKVIQQLQNKKTFFNYLKEGSSKN